MSGTWGAPSLPSGRDDFTARQQPDPRPVDDLSRFVLDRIRFTENGPRSEVPQVYGEPNGPMAHRYAGEVRRDMAAFRRIVKRYCDVKTEWESAPTVEERQVIGVFSAALAEAVREIALRFDTHPDFQEGWRLE